MEHFQCRQSQLIKQSYNQFIKYWICIMKPRLCSYTFIRDCRRPPHWAGAPTCIDIDAFQCMWLFCVNLKHLHLCSTAHHHAPGNCSQTPLSWPCREGTSPFPKAFLCTKALFPPCLCLECMLWTEIKNEVFSVGFVCVSNLLLYGSGAP